VRQSAREPHALFVTRDGFFQRELATLEVLDDRLEAAERLLERRHRLRLVARIGWLSLRRHPILPA
jgi:hypothetical protein